MQFVPQWWMNSYPAEIGSQLRSVGRGNTSLHAIYTPTDFVASFSGCRILLHSQAACNALMQEYAAGL